MESKEEKFKRIAEYRTKKILHSLKVLGNCSNNRVYIYTDEEVKKIFNTLKEQVEATRAKFIAGKENNSFKL